MQDWLKASLARLSQKSDVAVTIRYALERWSALLRYCEDGRVEMDNNAAERALRAVALGRTTIGLRDRTREENARPPSRVCWVGQAERDRSGSIPELGAAAHCRSPHQSDRGTAAVESASGQIAGGGGGMTPRLPQTNRVHNLPDRWHDLKRH